MHWDDIFKLLISNIIFIYFKNIYIYNISSKYNFISLIIMIIMLISIMIIIAKIYRKQISIFIFKILNIYKL